MKLGFCIYLILPVSVLGAGTLPCRPHAGLTTLSVAGRSASNCYYFRPDLQTAPQAETSCSSIGGKVFQPRLASEQVEIDHALSAVVSNRDYWLGIINTADGWWWTKSFAGPHDTKAVYLGFGTVPAYDSSNPQYHAYVDSMGAWQPAYDQSLHQVLCEVTGSVAPPPAPFPGQSPCCSTAATSDFSSATSPRLTDFQRLSPGQSAAYSEVASISTVSLLTCGIQCAQRPSCHAFAFADVIRSCRLLETSAGTHYACGSVPCLLFRRL